MITTDHRRVFCTYLPCASSLDIPAEFVSEDDIRRFIFIKGWLIDLHGEATDELIALQTHTTQKVAAIIATSLFPFDKDDHYCSLACVEKDT